MSPVNKSKRLSVWLIGRNDRTEYRETVELIRARASLLLCSQQATTAGSGQVGIDSGDVPDLIVLLQSYAGELSPSDVARLSARYPLAPVICVLGTYSEGETRSGRPLTNAHRVFWYNAGARLQQGFDAFECGKCPWWSQPSTRSDEEHWLSRVVDRSTCLTGRVAVIAATPSFAEPTIELLRRFGAESCFVGPPSQNAAESQVMSGFHCAIWDAAPSGRFRPIELAAAVEIVHPAPLIAMYTFPRTQDVERARDLGAAQTLPKLIAADDLIWHVRRVTEATDKSALQLHDPAA